VKNGDIKENKIVKS